MISIDLVIWRDVVHTKNVEKGKGRCQLIREIKRQRKKEKNNEDGGKGAVYVYPLFLFSFYERGKRIKGKWQRWIEKGKSKRLTLPFTLFWVQKGEGDW
jgi:hypothetical protein